MSKRTLKVLGLVAAVCVTLSLGAAVGGGTIYALTRDRDASIVVRGEDVHAEPGIVVAYVVPEGPAAEAGVTRGDVLLEIDGETLEDTGDLIRRLGELQPGGEVELTLLHGDDRRTVTVILGELYGQAYMGLVPCTALPAPHLEEPGVVIVEVLADSPAERAGLQEGDVIIAVDGQELDAETALSDLIADREPGDTVSITIERQGDEPREITVELAEHPDHEGKAYLGVRFGLGGRLRFLWGAYPPLGEFYPLPDLPHCEHLQGAVVLTVTEDSPASAAGLEPGDVIQAVDGESLDSQQALIDAIAGREPGDEIALTIGRPDQCGEQREIVVTLGEDPDEEGRAHLGVSIGSFLRLQHFGEGHLHGQGGLLVPPPEGRALERGEWPLHFEFDWAPVEECPGCSTDDF
jgi:S1-C subfamily serine protease